MHYNVKRLKPHGNYIYGCLKILGRFHWDGIQLQLTSNNTVIQMIPAQRKTHGVAIDDKGEKWGGGVKWGDIGTDPLYLWWH